MRWGKAEMGSAEMGSGGVGFRQSGVQVQYLDCIPSTYSRSTPCRPTHTTTTTPTMRGCD